MTPYENFFYWAPRLLGLAFVGFLSIFALDVFAEYSGWGAIVPLLTHLIPSFILLSAIVSAWVYEWVGTVIFLGFSIFYVSTVGFDQPVSWYIAITLPSAIVGILFFIGWIQKKKREEEHPPSSISEY